MNSLIYIPTGLSSPELEILLSKAQELINIKKKVNIITCHGGKNYTCSLNPYAQKTICFSCKNRLNNGLKNLKGSYNLSTTPKNVIKRVFPTKFLQNRKKLFKLFYKNIDIGTSSYSSYLNITRDLNLEGYYSLESLKKILNCSATLTDYFFNYLRNNKVDEIFIFNGRMSQDRPLFRIAKILNIKINIMEYSQTLKYFNGVRNFKDNLPFDYNYFSKKIKKFKSKLKLAQQKENFDKYFKKKQKGDVVNDKTSYIKNQVKNLLPKKWNFKKKNIVFFTSSDDEYEVLGDQYKSLVYKSQIDSITKIAKSFNGQSKKNYNFWIKMHPNMKNVKWDYCLDILKLRNISPNIHIIKPESKVSSYEMIEQCDKFLTFNSSSAVEAVYLKKPTILLSKTYFDKLNCFYTPKDHRHNLKLIFNSIKPKNKDIKKFVNFWVETGQNQKFFSHKFLKDYRFNKSSIKFNFLHQQIYFFSRFFTHFFYQNINYYFRNLKITKV